MTLCVYLPLNGLRDEGKLLRIMRRNSGVVMRRLRGSKFKGIRFEVHVKSELLILWLYGKL